MAEPPDLPYEAYSAMLDRRRLKDEEIVERLHQTHPSQSMAEIRAAVAAAKTLYRVEASSNFYSEPTVQAVIDKAMPYLRKGAPGLSDRVYKSALHVILRGVRPQMPPWDHEARMAAANIAPRKKNTDLPEPGDILSLAFLGILYGAFAFTFVRGLFGWLAEIWALFPAFVRSYPGAAMVGLVVIAIGALLFVVRERARFAYACLELGSAFGAAVEATSRLTTSGNTETLVFALLASTYIAVRGFENLAKAREARRIENLEKAREARRAGMKRVP